MVDMSTSAAEQVSVAQHVGEQDTKPEREPKIRKRLRPREVSGHDEAALSWFFGQGLSIYEKSTFGPIVEKIVMDGFGSAPCGRCDGAGILEDAGGVGFGDRCRSCDGTRYAPRKAGESLKWCLTCDGVGKEHPYQVEMPKGGWCPSCRGTGSSPVERRAMRRPRCQWCRPDVVVVKDERLGTTERLELVAARAPTHCCPNCKGTGDEPLTAKRVQNDSEGGGVIGNDTALTRFAITSRRTDKVKEISPALHAALEAFYGDVGNRWARSPLGRMFALFHLTPAGKKLARMGVPKPERKVKPKKSVAKKLEKRLASAIASGKRGEADRLAKQLEASRDRPPASAEDAELAALELNTQERIGVQANIQKTQPTDERRALLAKAQEQAEDLYKRAARAWNSVSTSKLERDATKRLEERLTEMGHESVAKMVRASAGGVR